MLLTEKIKVRFSNRLPGFGETKTFQMRAAVAQKPAFPVLEINAVREFVHQGAQQEALMFQRFLGLVLVRDVGENSQQPGDFARAIAHGCRDDAHEAFLPRGAGMFFHTFHREALANHLRLRLPMPDGQRRRK